MHLNKYERKVLTRLHTGTGCGPFEVLNALEDKGAIKVTVNKAEGDFDIVVTDAGRAALKPR